MKKILIIKHGSLGDIISSTSAINDIRNHYKNQKIIILTTRKYKNFFNNSDLVDDVLIDNRKGLIATFLIIKKLINLEIGIIIDLQNTFRTSIYSFFIRFFSKIKINGTGFFSNYRYKYSLKNPPTVIEGLANQIEILGIKTSRKPYLEWLNNNNNFDFNILSNKIFFIVNPGCSKNNYQKRWSAEKYAKICSYLITKNVLPVIIGSDEDKEAIEIIASKEKGILNLINKSSLDVIFQLSKKAKGAISNDTGPAHLIAATGCKIHLLLSNFSNSKTVIPQGENVTFTQNKNIDSIEVVEVIKKMNQIFQI